MRDYLARALVRYVSGWYDQSFEAHYQCQFLESKQAAWLGRVSEKLLLPLALRIDRNAAAQQMVEEAWWG